MRKKINFFFSYFFFLVSVQILFELSQGENNALKLFLPVTLLPHGDYPSSLDLSIKVAGGVEKLDCSWKDAKISDKKDSISISQKKGFTEDLLVQITPKRTIEPNVLVESSKEIQTQSILLNYYPMWNIDEDLIVQCSEIIFLIDRSGSMSGSRISQVRTTMGFFLKALPETVKFNISNLSLFFLYLKN